MITTLSACLPLQDAADQIAREQARTYVNTEIQGRFPGVNAEPITDCVINNASAQEIVAIAGGVALGDTQTASATVNTVLQRPETIRCTTSGAIGGLINGGNAALTDLFGGLF